jgi:thiol:disulfide interchange protein DsbD
MLDFYADWCVACKQMERDTFANLRVRDALMPVVLLQADVTAYNDADRELMRTLQVIGPPSILFFGTDGMERTHYRVVGFMPAENFANLVNEAVSQ